jgi:RNA polymerase sigma-70 factor (ECF subfamily)
MLAASPNAQLHPALVNGAAGLVVIRGGRPVAVMGFLVIRGTIAEMNVVLEPERVRHATAAFLADEDLPSETGGV